MSIDTAVARVSEIMAMQQALLNPASTVGQQPAAASTTATTNTAAVPGATGSQSFATQLASASAAGTAAPGATVNDPKLGTDDEPDPRRHRRRTPTVQVGQTVTAGQQIATPRANPYNGIVGNFEIGRANPASPGQPLAQVVSNPGQMVQEFYSWLKGLGGPTATSTSNAGAA
jgi:biotin carboxyl carrier protein